MAITVQVAERTGLEANLFFFSSPERSTMAIMLAVHSIAANVTAMQQQKMH